MNKIFLIGRLTRDPEVRYTQSGKAVTSFSLAVDRTFGPNKEADFIPVITWEKLAENCGNILSKGQKVAVEGRLQIRSYEAKDGQKRTVAEVIAQSVEFLERKQGASSNQVAATHPIADEGVPGQDDIPF